jgi:transcriptional regulator with XRE-family HTH domain
VKKPILKTFGTNVQKIRKQKGLSQEELAKKCRLHRTYIGGIERGERNVSLINLKKIATALGVKIDDLI